MNKKERKNSAKQINNGSDVASGMLRRSEKDLKVFTRNYRKKDYSHSLTNMQQAVEKFGKSILATLEDYTEEDLRKIGHKLVDFLVKKIKEKFDEIAKINVEMEKNLRKIIDRFQTDYKKKYMMGDDLYIAFDQLEIMLKDFDYYREQIQTGIIFMLSNFPMQSAIKEFVNTSDNIITEVVHKQGIELTDEQRLQVKKEGLNYLLKGDYFQELQNTLYIVLLLGFTVILSVNLEKHVSSSRYDINEEFRYSKNSSIVRILPLMHTTMKKMVETFWYLLSLNIPEEE